MSNYSIKDVARLSGVSTATVSRVINNKGKYSEETRERVLKVIDEIGYKVNSNAQSLRTKISKTIGILVPDIGNYFFADLVQNIEKNLFEKGYTTIICNTDRSIGKEDAYLKILESKNVDGLIVISGNIKKGFNFVSNSKSIPYICIDRKPKNIKDTIFISSDHFNGAKDATNHLLDTGCNHPIIIRPKQMSSSNQSRLNGFLEALKENNLEFSEKKNQLVINYEDSIENKLLTFLKENKSVDGIFTVNDNLAIEVLNLLLANGYEVPEDINLIGFDDINISKYTKPALSTIKQDVSKIAEETVSNILKCIDNKCIKGRTILIPTKLVTRESTQ